MIAIIEKCENINSLVYTFDTQLKYYIVFLKSTNCVRVHLVTMDNGKLY